MTTSYGKIAIVPTIKPMRGAHLQATKGYESKQGFLDGVAATLRAEKPNRAARRLIKKARKQGLI